MLPPYTDPQSSVQPDSNSLLTISRNLSCPASCCPLGDSTWRIAGITMPSTSARLTTTPRDVLYDVKHSQKKRMMFAPVIRPSKDFRTQGQGPVLRWLNQDMAGLGGGSNQGLSRLWGVRVQGLSSESRYLADSQVESSGVLLRPLPNPGQKDFPGSALLRT